MARTPVIMVSVNHVWLAHIFLGPMHIEIDQSGQIGRQNTDTIFAFSNSIDYAVVIPARVKRALFERFKTRYQEVREPYLKIFTAGIFLLIKDHIGQIEKIMIDEEFTGQDAKIRGELLRHIRQVHPSFTKDRIVFWRIGKKSGAHYRAIEVYRARKGKGKAKPDKVISLQEMMNVLNLK